MKIEVLYFEGCPNHMPTVDRIRRVLRAMGLDEDIVEIEIRGPGDAGRMHFLGSPTVRVEGVDIDPGARSRTDYGYSCRTYRGSGGLPPIEMIEDALASPAGASPALSTQDCCVSELEPEGDAKRDTRPWMSAGLFTAGGSFGTAMLSSACCWLPLLLIGFGVSSGGLSAFFESTRPIFLGLTAALLSLAFYMTYFRKQNYAEGSACEIPHPRLRRFNRASLWIAMVGVVAFTAFPLYVNALPIGAARDGNAQELVAGEMLSLPIEGMTCAGCATTVEQALLRTPGVLAATVSFEESRAELILDPSAPASHALLAQTLHNSGFAIAQTSEPARP